MTPLVPHAPPVLLLQFAPPLLPQCWVGWIWLPILVLPMKMVLTMKVNLVLKEALLLLPLIPVIPSISPLLRTRLPLMHLPPHIFQNMVGFVPMVWQERIVLIILGQLPVLVQPEIGTTGQSLVVVCTS